MVYAIPIFENNRCLLRFKNTRPETVTLTHVIIRREPFFAGAVPQILKEQIKLPPNLEVDFDVTDALLEHVATSGTEERLTRIHFDLSYEPEDDQPDGLYEVVSRGKAIIAFRS
jgi:hypothetical protein